MEKLIDLQYLQIAKKIIKKGHKKETRQGGYTLSIFGESLKIKNGVHWNNFPYVLQSKNVWMHGVVTELLWFLSGDTHIKYLVDNGVNIWNADAYRFDKNNSSLKPDLTFDEYVKLIKDNEVISEDQDSRLTACDMMGDLGPIYGYQMVKTGGNQIKRALDILRTEPTSRRIVVNMWNQDHLGKMGLPPCHFSFVLNARKSTFKEKQKFIKFHTKLTDDLALDVPEYTLNLQFNMRSVDWFLGCPFDLASYGLMLNLFCRELNMIPGELYSTFTDTHLYSEHIPAMKEQIAEYKKLEKLQKVEIELPDFNFENPKDSNVKDFKLKNYKAIKIKAELIA